MSEMTKTCKCCGTVFKTGDSRKKYCSKDCATNARREVYTRSCEYCGKPFTTGYARQKFCSKECHYQYQLQEKRESNIKERKLHERQCPCCGNKFTTAYGMKIYCSPSCSVEGQKIKAAGRKKGMQPKALPKEITKVCINCGNEFKTSAHKQKYCSPACMQEMRKKSKKQKKILSISEIAVLARESGMSYGQYVQKEQL